MKKILSIFLILFFTLVVFSIITGNKHLGLLTTELSVEQKSAIKRYLFPYKLIRDQEYTVQRLINIIQAQERTLKSHDIVKAELDFKKSKKKYKNLKKNL